MIRGQPKRSTRRSSAQPYYDARWRAARLAYLAEHPLCRLCQDLGRLSAATVVDHVRQHAGDPDLFWSEANWQSLCQRCHDSHKQAQEKSGHLRGCSADGQPLDLAHPWRAAR